MDAGPQGRDDKERDDSLKAPKGGFDLYAGGAGVRRYHGCVMPDST